LFVCGRRHFYEGGADAIDSLIEFVRGSGGRRLLVTCAAGSLARTIVPKELLLVDDILDLQFRGRLGRRARRETGVPPIERPASERALSLDSRLLDEVARSADEAGVPIQRGSAVACAGPMYESPAEIRALQQSGAAIVTMSGAPEIAAANRIGIRTAMIGLVTNWASGISGGPLHHEDVLETAGTAVSKLRQLIEIFVQLGSGSGDDWSCGKRGQRV
jgi:purine nucleoside phosphorylase